MRDVILDPAATLAMDDPHAGTRERVARSILENGPSTAAALGQRLGLTPAAVRRHLDTLLGEGMIEAREQRVHGQRGRGRPAKVFALTEAGRDAVRAGLRRPGGQCAAVPRRNRRRTSSWQSSPGRGSASWRSATVRSSRPQPPGTAPTALARALSADGYAASAQASPTASGEQLCQHHCPVAHVAEQFPQLCEAETEVFARLLGTHVQRLATIAHGDGVCTTHIPRGPAISACRTALTA